MTYTNATNAYHLWVGNTLVATNAAKAQLANGTVIDSFMFYGENSTGNLAANTVDNFTYATYLVSEAVATAPTVTSSASSSISATGATLNGNATADGGASITERGFYTKTSSGVTSSDTKRVEGGTGTGAFSNSVTGLSVNTRYYYKAYASNSVGISLSSTEQNFWTLANTPSAPTLGSATSSSLTVTIGSGDGNPSNTEYAIQETGGQYVQANGALNASAVWQTAATWGTTTVTGLSAATSYTFQVKARNGANTETVFGSTAALSTGAASSPVLTAVTLSNVITSTYPSASVGVAFVAEGTNLTGDITVTPQTGFELSTTDTNSGFGSSAITVTTGTTVWVRFAANRNAGSYDSATAVVLSGGGASVIANVATSSSGNTISKATPSITTNPTASAITYGQTLASSTLTNGVASVGGSFAFTSPSTVPSAGTASQGVTFTPTDTTNYNNATTSVSVTVNKANQTITFNSLTNRVVGTTTALGASSTSGLTISYTSSNTNVATISGVNVVAVAPGVATITANQGGDSNYNPASPQTQILNVAAAAGATDLVAGWDFQTTNNVGTAVASAPNSPTNYVANFGTGTIFMDGSNGSSSWASPSLNPEVTAFSGTTVNAATNFSSVTTSGALGLANSSANAKKIIFKFSMNGKRDLVVSYAAQKTSSGFSSHVWETSANGTNWVAAQTITNISTSFGAIVLTGISSLNFMENAFIRLTVDGATTASGNNRLDNIQLVATTAEIPGITPNGSFSGLSKTYGSNSVSPISTIGISGGGLRSDITATAPSGFEVSSDGTTWASTATFTNSGGFANGNLSLRLSPTAAAGTYSGNVALSSAGATPVNVAVASSTVSAKALSITANLLEKPFGETLTGGAGSTAFTSSGLVNGDVIDSVTISYTGGADANDPGGIYAGAIVPSSAVGASFSAANYTITYTSGDLTVTTLPSILVSGTLTNRSTTYGTPSAPTTFTTLGRFLTNDLTVAPPAGFEVSSDGTNYSATLTLPSVSGEVPNTTIRVRLAADAAFGTYSGNVDVSGGGATTRSLAIGASTVAKKALTITGLSGESREYDRTADATTTGTPVYVGLENGESFSVAGTPVASFADKVATTNKLITITGYSAPSGNYSITDPTVTADITPKALSITNAAVTSRAFNGTNSATITGGLDGVISGDVVTLVGAGTFASPNAGTGIAVTSTSTLTGADAANYTLTQPTGLTGDITKASQTITFNALDPRTIVDAPFNLTATTTAIGLSVSYTSSDPSVATVSSNTVTIVGKGATTITANQAGDANYDAANPVAQALVVGDEILARWTFESTNSFSANITNSAITNLPAEVGSGTASGFHAATNTVWSSPAGNGSPRSLSANYWAMNDYIQFSVPSTGKTGLILSWDQIRSGSSTADNFKIQYSTDGNSFTDVPSATSLAIANSAFFADATTNSSWSSLKRATNTSISVNLASIPQVNNQSSVIFRIVANTPTNGTSGSGSSRLDNVTVTAANLPEISASVTTLTNAVNTSYGVASPSPASFTVTGLQLTEGVTVTPPLGFEVSASSNFLSAGDFDTPLVLGSGGTVTETIYVRLKADAIPGSYSGNISLTSTGASTVNVATVSSTMGYASADGQMLSFDFENGTVGDALTSLVGWSSDSPDGSFVTGYDGSKGGAIGDASLTNRVAEAAYRFDHGTSRVVVFEWKQTIFSSSEDAPELDSFGWIFRNGNTTLFTLRFLPEERVDNDPNWVDWNENDVRNDPSQLIVVGFDQNGSPVGGKNSGLGPWDQVNFEPIGRDDQRSFRVTIDLDSQTWSASISKQGGWFGLVFDAPLPSGTTQVDRIVALWEMEDTTADTNGFYDGGANVMAFDDVEITGSSSLRTQVALTANPPTAPVVYNGSNRPVSVNVTPSTDVTVGYWNTATEVKLTSEPVVPGTYKAKVTVADSSTHYAIPQYVTYTVAPKALTISGLTAQDKEYDRTTSATLNTGSESLVGTVGSDDVSLSGSPTGNFTSATVGSNKQVTVTGYTLTGADAGNYTLTQPAGLTGDITAKQLTVSGAVANNKVYDRTNTATINLTGATLNGVVPLDDVSLTNGGGTFASMNVADGIAVTASLGLDGADAGNYFLSQPTGLTANITAKQLTVSGAVADGKIYNGSDAATISGGTLVGVISGDTVGLTGGGTFQSPNAGLRNVTANFSLTGADKENYFLTQPTGLSATISQASVTVTVDAKSKTFGDNDPAFTYSPSGLIGSDALSGSLSRVSGEDVGTYAIGQVGDLSAGANYLVSITPADLTINKATPTIAWTNPTAITYGTALSSSQLNATANVDGTFTYAPTNGAVLSAGTNTLTAVFTATDTNNYVSPLTNSVSLVVNKASQTITFPTLTNGIVGGSTTLTASSDSGLTVSYSSSSTNVASVSGTTLNFVGAGSVTITASQAGNGNYEAAKDVSQTITVASADGPWDIWADSYSMANGTERAKSSDPDGDGFNNALEFAFGTHPKSRNAEVFVSHTKVGTNYVVTFKKRKDTNEVTYDIRSSSDLKLAFTNGATMNLGTATGVDANYEQTSVNLPISTNRGFVRMQATVKVEPSR